MYVGPQSTTGLGELGALPIVPVVGAISSLFGGNPKDPGRLATNQQHFTAYTAGCNPSDLNFLKGMSGKFGVVKDSQYCVNGCSGWATSKAKDDAYKKYQAASSGGYCKASSASPPVAPAAGIPVVAGQAPGIQAANILGMNAPALAISAAALIGIFAIMRSR